MSYDDWKTTDPSAAEYCENGHWHCPARCPVCGECRDSCDHTSDDEERDLPPEQAEETSAPAAREKERTT